MIISDKAEFVMKKLKKIETAHICLYGSLDISYILNNIINWPNINSRLPNNGKLKITPEG